MNKTIENLSSVIREIAAQEAEKHTDIVIGEIAEKNSDGTYDVFIVPDFVTPVTNIPNSSIYDFNIGEGCYVRKYNNQLQSSAIVDKIGFSQPRFGTGGEGSSSVSGSLVMGKTSELQNDGSDGVHPFIDTSALLQSNPMFYPSTSEDKIFSAKAVSGAFTYLTEQVAEALDMTVLVNKEQNFSDSQKRTGRINIGAASQEDIEGINNNIANCVQVNAQTFTKEQKTQARTNIGALSSADLNVWLQRTNTEEDLNTLANVANGNAYISRYDTSTANTPEANTQGNVISLRNSSGQLTQIAMEVQSGKIYYRASATSADFGTWKEIGGAIGQTASGGGAIGFNAKATSGGAIGSNAKATSGGAIGDGAIAGDGFSGGNNAQVGKDSDGNYIDAIQLGTGRNNTPKTLQVYNYKVYDFNKDSLYCYYLNDKTPAVVESLWKGSFSNTSGNSLTIPNYSQYDYFIIQGNATGMYTTVIRRLSEDQSYGIVKKADDSNGFFAFDINVSATGIITFGSAVYYPPNNYTLTDYTDSGYFWIREIVGVKLCKE